MRAQMNFDLAAVEKNRRLRILVTRVDGRNLFVNRRFTHARNPQHAARKVQIAGQLFHARLHVILEHGIHLPRRPGKQSDCTTFMFEIKPRRGAVRIRQDFGAVDHHRLS